MSGVMVEDRDGVALVRLERGVTNAINRQLLEELTAAVEAVEKERRGMVLAGGEKFFSIGLDLPELLGIGREEMTRFWKLAGEAFLGLFTVPVPTASAICGHATAGGAILALTTDFRIAASGRKLIGLNEVKIGLPVPYLADLILRQVVSDGVATEMLYGGEFQTTEQAAAVGLVDAVLPIEEVEEAALAKVRHVAEHSAPAFAAIKATRVELVRERFERNAEARMHDMLELWFDEKTQKLLAAAAEKF